LGFDKVGYSRFKTLKIWVRFRKRSRSISRVERSRKLLRMLERLEKQIQICELTDIP